MSRRIIVLPEELEQIENRLIVIEKMLKTKQPNNVDPILTSEQVMEMLKVSRRSLQNWRDNGLVQFSAIGNKFYYRMSALNKMLDTHIAN